MPGATFLEGDKVKLRTFEREHLEQIQKAYNKPEVRKFMSHDRPANMEQEEEYFENVVSNDEGLHLTIVADEELAGSLSIKPKERDEGAGEIGIFVFPEHHGKGYGTEASRLLINHAFSELRYHKILARVYESNQPSQKLWKKLGFQKEGELREQNFTDGQFENVMLYGILEDEWQ